MMGELVEVNLWGRSRLRNPLVPHYFNTEWSASVEELYLVNKPLQAAGMSANNVRG